MMIDRQLVVTLCNLLDLRENIEQIENHLNLLKQHERKTQENAIYMMKQSMKEKASQGAPVVFGHKTGPVCAFMRFGNRIDFQKGMIATEVSPQSPPSAPPSLYKMPPDDPLILQPNVKMTVGEIAAQAGDLIGKNFADHKRGDAPPKGESVPMVGTSGIIVDPFSDETESEDDIPTFIGVKITPRTSFLSALISDSPDSSISPRVEEALWYEISQLHKDLSSRGVSPSTFWSTIAGNLNPDETLPEDEKFGKREKTVTLQLCEKSMDALKKWASANNAKVASAARSLMRFALENKAQLFEELRQLYDRVDSSEFFEVPQGEE